MGAKAITQARLRAGQIAVPDLVGAFGQYEARNFLAAGRIEPTELDALGVLGKHGEIHAETIPARTERKGGAREQPVGERLVTSANSG